MRVTMVYLKIKEHPGSILQMPF